MPLKLCLKPKYSYEPQKCNQVSEFAENLNKIASSGKYKYTISNSSPQNRIERTDRARKLLNKQCIHRPSKKGSTQ